MARRSGSVTNGALGHDASITVVRSTLRPGAAIEKAEEIMANAPFGIALTKEGMWTALEIPGLQAAIDLENRQQIMASATDDAREALAAFRDRRPPRFTNS